MKYKIGETIYKTRKEVRKTGKDYQRIPENSNDTASISVLGEYKIR